MTIGSIRSGLVEALHPVTAVAVDSEGQVIAELGTDLDREFFLRSAPKPLQAAVAQRFGADLGPEQHAIASASHSAFPLHVAYVESMLAEVGLGVGDLLCPPGRPVNPDADRLWASVGRSAPERVFHNCSGKHAGMLRACVTQSWPLTYTDSDHPLQQAIADAAAEAGGRAVQPTGTDGCGIPTLRGDVTSLARIFGRLVNDADYRAAAVAAARFAPLTADGLRPEAELARWLPAVVKVGAEACVGVGLLEHGVAFAAKCWTGDFAPAFVAVVELITRVGVLPDHQRSMLEPIARPVVLGGGEPVGVLELLDA